MMASVNNDALAELIVALALLWLIRYLRSEELPIWQLGLIVGAALLTKITITFLVLIAPLAMWLKWRRQGAPAREFLQSISIFLSVAVLLGGLWWLRNISVYGFPDFLGLAAHDAVVVDQPRTADYIAQHGFPVYLSQLTGTTFRSFWGQFGWMALPLDSVHGGWIYRGFALLTLAWLTGVILAAHRRFVDDSDAAGPRISADAIIVLSATMLLVALQFIYYNIEFQQWQGRYLFPALIPIAFLLVYGLDHCRDRLLSRWEPLRWLTPLGMISLCALDIYLLFCVIVPGLSPT